MARKAVMMAVASSRALFQLRSLRSFSSGRQTLTTEIRSPISCGGAGHLRVHVQAFVAGNATGRGNPNGRIKLVFGLIIHDLAPLAEFAGREFRQPFARDGLAIGRMHCLWELLDDVPFVIVAGRVGTLLNRSQKLPTIFAGGQTFFQILIEIREVVARLFVILALLQTAMLQADDRLDQAAGRLAAGLVDQLLRGAAVPVEAAGDQKQQRSAEQDKELPLQAGFAQDAF